MSASLNPDLVVTDIDRAVTFYKHALGLAEQDRGDFFAMMGREGFRIMMETPKSPDPTTKGLLERQGSTPRATVNFWIQVEDLATEENRIKTAGIRVHGPVTKPYGFREVTLQDPDGYTWTLAQKVDVK